MHKLTAEQASHTDLKRARTRALKRSGFTHIELASQAQRQDFMSAKARVAWLTVNSIDEALKS